MKFHKNNRASACVAKLYVQVARTARPWRRQEDDVTPRALGAQKAARAAGSRRRVNASPWPAAWSGWARVSERVSGARSAFARRFARPPRRARLLVRF